MTVANLGDRHPLDYGGYIVMRETGPEVRTRHYAEYWDEPDEQGKYTVYVFDLDQLKLVEGHLVPLRYGPGWPHPVERYEEWFHERLDAVASFVGGTKEELERDFISADPVARAWAYRAVGEYHGWENLDSYPLRLTRAEMEKRWPEYA